MFFVEPMADRIGLVIFDCDGVLIDSEPLSLRADLACLAEYGIAMPEQALAERYTGISMADMLADLETRYGRPMPGFINRQWEILRRLFEAELRPIDGIAEVLDSMPCRACVASSGTPERLRHALATVGLLKRFETAVFSASEVARGKPAPDLFLYAADRLGIGPADCVVVEDSLPGIAAALAAGMTAIGFCGGSHCPPGHVARLAAAGAAKVIGRMPELLPLLAPARR